MTAETLKPFITPTSVNNFPATHSSTTAQNRQKRSNYLSIGLGVTAVTLATVLLVFTVWNSVRACKLEAEVKSLNRIVESLQKRLGIQYLDELNEFEKEYENALIDDPHTLDDNDADSRKANKGKPDLEDANNEDDDILDTDEDVDDEDEDENDYDILSYDEILRKFNSYDDQDDEDEDDEDISDGDNLYDDFEKFKDSNKKDSRKTRSIELAHNELPPDATQLKTQSSKGEVDEAAQHFQHEYNQRPKSISFDSTLKDRSKHHRQHHFRTTEHLDSRRHGNQRRLRHPALKSAKIAGTIKSTSRPMIPAAHFHLNSKVTDQHAAINVDSYPGDMYIGQPSWTNEYAYEHYFKLENGVLTVREPGLYYVYAQVCYNNTHDQNGYVIFHGHKPILQCLNTVPTNMPLKIHTCHTSGLIHLRANETLHLRDFHSDRNVILKETNNRSYFGLMKI